MRMSPIRHMPRAQAEDLLFYALRSIYYYERDCIERFKLDYQQIYLLKFLKRKSPFRVSDIAGELRIPVFAATRLIRHMETIGLIEKKRDSRDRRNIYIRMTPGGEAMLGNIESYIVEMTMSGLKGYDEEQAGVIVDLVKHLGAILGVEADRPPGDGER